MKFRKSKQVNYMPMNRMATTCWFSLAKVFYAIRKNKNSDFATRP